MKYITVSNDLKGSNLVQGCMRLNQLELKEIESLVRTGMEYGINHFDHADIYGQGECETVFAKALQYHSSMREQMILQSKCGIQNGYYDSSKEHIISSTEQILKRLRTDYLDILLIHRPDLLMEPEEVAEAVTQLKKQGKIRHFGVSNHTPNQMELLNRYLDDEIIINQVQFGLAHTNILDSSICFNTNYDQAINRDSGVVDYCRLNNITIQAWSPFQKGMFEGVFFQDQEKYKELNQKVKQLSKTYQVSEMAIAVAFITTHPANMQVVLGTTKKERLVECVQGSALKLSRSDWYGLYKAAGNLIP